MWLCVITMPTEQQLLSTEQLIETLDADLVDIEKIVDTQKLDTPDSKLIYSVLSYTAGVIGYRICKKSGKALNTRLFLEYLEYLEYLERITLKYLSSEKDNIKRIYDGLKPVLPKEEYLINCCFYYVIRVLGERTL